MNNTLTYTTELDNSEKVNQLIHKQFNREFSATLALKEKQSAIRTSPLNADEATPHLLTTALIGDDGNGFANPKRRAILLDTLNQKLNWAHAYASLNANRLSKAILAINHTIAQCETKKADSNPSQALQLTSKSLTLKKQVNTVVKPQLSMLQTLQNTSLYLVKLTAKPESQELLINALKASPSARFFFLDFPKNQIGDTQNIPEMALKNTFRQLSGALAQTPLLDGYTGEHPLLLLMAHIAQFVEKTKEENGEPEPKNETINAFERNTENKEGAPQEVAKEDTNQHPFTTALQMLKKHESLFIKSPITEINLV